MTCDTCNKMSDSLTSLSSKIVRYLPYKYAQAQVCDDCRRKLDNELDKLRSIAWQKVALLLVDMIKNK